MLDNNSRATIDLSQHTPDYFSCQNCAAYKRPGFDGTINYSGGFANLCLILQERGICRALLLARALETGAVQVVLHIGQPEPALALLERGRP